MQGTYGACEGFRWWSDDRPSGTNGRPRELKDQGKTKSQKQLQ